MSLRVLAPCCLTLFGLLCPVALAAAPLPPAERLRWFQDAKFGLFLHWGLFSIPGEGEWIMSRRKIPAAEYAKLAEQLNPARFSARAWVELAKRAGARYVVVTAKHHDGFCLFDSKLTNFTVTKATPFKRDVLRELADECRKQDLKFGVYYSILDWHHPDFLPAPVWDRDNPLRAHADFARYLKYLEGQLRELCTRYGKIDLLWYDGGWHHTGDEHKKTFARLNALVRELQPHILINNRSNLPEDFGTPEQHIPPAGPMGPDGKPIAWEACLTMNAGHGSFPPTAAWGYDKNETVFRSATEVVRSLSDVVSKGGSLLLSVGPMPDGTIQQEIVENLEAVGRWLQAHGEAIYGTTASPFRQLAFWGRATRKGNTLYLHAFHWPADRLFLLPGMTDDLLQLSREQGTLLGAPGVQVVPLFKPEPEKFYGVRVPAPAPGEPAVVLKLAFRRWPRIDPYVKQLNTKGVFELPIYQADLHGQLGQRARLEADAQHVYLASWTNKSDWLSWDIEVPRAGVYEVLLDYACSPDAAGGELVVAIGRNELPVTVAGTGAAAPFQETLVGKLHVGGGKQTVTLKALAIPKDQELLRLRGVVLRPVN